MANLVQPNGTVLCAFARTVRSLRVIAGLEIATVADTLGLTWSAAQKIETGRRCVTSSAKARRLDALFGSGEVLTLLYEDVVAEHEAVKATRDQLRYPPDDVIRYLNLLYNTDLFPTARSETRTTPDTDSRGYR